MLLNHRRQISLSSTKRYSSNRV